MNSDLYIPDQKYISVKEASKFSGYSPNYIGQLCRSKKIEATLVGKSWQISSSSFSKYITAQITSKMRSKRNLPRPSSTPVDPNIRHELKRDFSLHPKKILASSVVDVLLTKGVPSIFVFLLAFGIFTAHGADFGNAFLNAPTTASQRINQSALTLAYGEEKVGEKLVTFSNTFFDEIIGFEAIFGKSFADLSDLTMQGTIAFEGSLGKNLNVFFEESKNTFNVAMYSTVAVERMIAENLTTTSHVVLHGGVRSEVFVGEKLFSLSNSLIGTTLGLEHGAGQKLFVFDGVILSHSELNSESTHQSQILYQVQDNQLGLSDTDSLSHSQPNSLREFNDRFTVFNTNLSASVGNIMLSGQRIASTLTPRAIPQVTFNIRLARVVLADRITHLINGYLSLGPNFVALSTNILNALAASQIETALKLSLLSSELLDTTVRGEAVLGKSFADLSEVMTNSTVVIEGDMGEGFADLSYATVNKIVALEAQAGEKLFVFDESVLEPKLSVVSFVNSVKTNITQNTAAVGSLGDTLSFNVTDWSKTVFDTMAGVNDIAAIFGNVEPQSAEDTVARRSLSTEGITEVPSMVRVEKRDKENHEKNISQLSAVTESSIDTASLNVYNSVHGWFDQTTDTLSALFRPDVPEFTGIVSHESEISTLIIPTTSINTSIVRDGVGNQGNIESRKEMERPTLVQ